MNTFKQKSLYAAIVAGLAAAGAAGTAQAVHVNPDGLGQVLVFPYYTTRAGHDTLISITNTTTQFKAVKVRFLEGKNSREVLDFNLFLSPQDVWTGAITQVGAEQGGARLVSGDNSCVTPSDLFSETRRDNGTPALLLNTFKNYQYTGLVADTNVYATLDRTREGYFEVIEMGVITDAKVQGYIKHSLAGLPANCSALDGLDPGAGNAVQFPNTGAAMMTAPTGGLGGRASIVNSANGAHYVLTPTALDNWWAPVVPGPLPYSNSGNTSPSLSNQVGIDTASNVFYNGGVLRAVWNTTREAVSATIMRNQVINEYVKDLGTSSNTDWIVTFPTKRDFVSVGAGVAVAPFANNFNVNTSTGACDPFTLAVYNREEGTTGLSPTQILPSPQPPAVVIAGAQLCWEANVVSFGGTTAATATSPAASSVFGSLNLASTQVDSFVNPPGGTVSSSTAATGITASGTVFTTPVARGNQGPAGWYAMSFNGAGQRITPASATLNGAALGVGLNGTHIGLPVIGAMAHNYSKSNVVSTYGGVIPHTFTRNIQ